MRYSVRCGKKYQIAIDKHDNLSKATNIKVGKKNYQLEIREIGADGSIKSVIINNKILPVNVERRNDGFPHRVQVNGESFDVEIKKVESTRYRPKSPERQVSDDVVSQLPGQIISILVKKGETVKKGQPILILESMKMENEILSPKNGVVKRIHIEKNQMIMKNHLMMEIT